MIIDVHKKLDEAIKSLPSIQGKKPVYQWGDELHLNQLIKTYNDDKKEPYPFVYDITGRSEQDKDRKTALVNLQLVIAVPNPHTDYLNPKRWKTSYQDWLFPTAQNLATLFEKGSIFLWDGEFELLEFPNYGNGKENETTSIWDALRLDTTITINNHCFKDILKF
jgi:hypothetical protein